MWWAVVTVTTVGYADIYPRSVGGRLVAMALMMVGIGFIAVLTATVASFFVKTDREDEQVAITNALARIEADLAEVNVVSVRPSSLAACRDAVIRVVWRVWTRAPETQMQRSRAPG